MTRDVWKALYREARKLRKEDGDRSTYMSGTQKSYFIFQDITHRWVVKKEHGHSNGTAPDYSWNGDTIWGFWLGVHDEEKVYRLLPPKYRPRTLFLDGVIIQEYVDCGMDTPRRMERELKEIGVSDFTYNNCGRTLDGRPVIQDWGYLRNDPETPAYKKVRPDAA